MKRLSRTLAALAVIAAFAAPTFVASDAAACGGEKPASPKPKPKPKPKPLQPA
jgi:hypothetical protein